MELFIARGYKNNVQGLFGLFQEGELDEEIRNIRARAKQVK